MMRKVQWSFLLSLVLVIGVALPVRADDGQAPVVRAVFFYSPTCPHCHDVITEVLPPLMARYKEQLQIAMADTYTAEGHEAYQAAAEQYQFERMVVPIMIIGEEALLGGQEIAERLPGLVELGLAGGGLDWPIAGAEELPLEVYQPSVGELIARDMPGNAIAIVVLGGMIVSAIYVVADGVRILQRQSRRRGRRVSRKREAAVHKEPVSRRLTWQDWTVLGVCVVGLCVAAYLTYVEVTLTEAVCGPVGDCNAVQQSKYARLFGLIPVAGLGLAGYVTIVAVWLVGKLGRGKIAETTPVLLLGLVLFGAGFSIYLTFLEPFVIGATCSWCLASSICMTALLLLLARPGWEALRLLRM